MVDRRETRTVARRMAGLMVAFRSTAYFYPTREGRRAAIQRLLTDARFFHVARTYTVQNVVPLRAKDAVFDFCMGHNKVYEFGRRLRRAFVPSRRSAAASGAAAVSSNVSPPAQTRRAVENFWLELYLRLRAILAVPGADGARIEFARQFELDASAVFTRRTDDAIGDVRPALIAPSRCVHLLVSMGVPNGAGESVATDTPRFTVNLYGTNYVWIHSDAMYTLGRADRHPPAFDNNSQMKAFVGHLVAAGVGYEPDPRNGHRIAIGRNTPVMTSLSHGPVSFRLVLAMPDGGSYVANVFYVSADDTCSTDFSYKRRYLSNACRCENRLAHWRVCVSVVATNGAPIDGLVGNRISEFALTALRAFERTKADQGAHYYIDLYTGLALINYTYDSVAIGGRSERSNIAEDRTTAARVCDLHRWLAIHDEPRLWLPTEGTRILRILKRTPQMLVVHRPLVSESASTANGPNLFTKYKSFDDVVSKHVLLSVETLLRGFTDDGRAVAFKGSDTYWIYNERPGEELVNVKTTEDGNGGGGMTEAEGKKNESELGGESSTTSGPAWLRAANDLVSSGILRPAGARDTRPTTALDEHRYVGDLFRVLFSAPSRLYAHVDALSILGFDLRTERNKGACVRAFTHADVGSPPTTDNLCTVFCSSPLIVIDDTTTANATDGTRFETVREVEPFRVLKHVKSESVVDAYADATTDATVANRTFAKCVVPLNDFWPGVYAVKTYFTDSVLENVHFVFFTSADGSEAVSRLTADNLARLARYNADNSFRLLPAPVVYALHSAFSHTNGNTVH